MKSSTACLAVVILLAASCGGSSAETTSTSSATSPTTANAIETTTPLITTTTSPATTTTTEPPPTIEIVAHDHFFEGVPTEPVPLRTTLTLTNASDSEFHSLAIGHFGEDQTPLDELAKLGLWELIFAGELTSVLFAMPGEEYYGRLTGSGWKPPVLDRVGRWVIFCNVPRGSDPEKVRTHLETTDQPPEEIEGEPRHNELGEIAELWVVAPS